MALISSRVNPLAHAGGELVIDWLFIAMNSLTPGTYIFKQNMICIMCG